MLSTIKKARQQAKEHSSKVTEKTKEEEEAKKPYRHVPTHAALDAMAGTPASWRAEERPRILEAHRRRSAMATNFVQARGYPQDSSSTSYMSYSSGYNYNHSNIPAPRRHSEIQVDYFGYKPSRKGKEPESIPSMVPGVAIPMTPSGRASALSSRGTAQASSSGASIGSEDDLEMRSGKQGAKASPHVPQTSSSNRPIPSRTNSSESVNLHHLHPSHQRKTSGSDRYYPPTARSTHFTKPQPIDPRTICNDIPPVPSLPTLHFDQAFEHSAPAHSDSSKSASSVSSGSSVRNSGSTAPSSILLKTNQNSTSSFASLQQKPTKSVTILPQPQQTLQDEAVSPVEARQPRSDQAFKPSKRRLPRSRQSETESGSHQSSQVVPSPAKSSNDAVATVVQPTYQPARPVSEFDGKKGYMPKVTRRLSKSQRETHSPEQPQAPKEKKRWTFLGLKRTASVTV